MLVVRVLFNVVLDLDALSTQFMSMFVCCLLFAGRVLPLIVGGQLSELFLFLALFSSMSIRFTCFSRSCCSVIIQSVIGSFGVGSRGILF